MRLYQLSRLGSHWLWGRPLSGDHMLANAELYRPVELGWQVMLARFAIWKLGSEGKPQNEKDINSSSILGHLLDLREVRNLLSLSTIHCQLTFFDNSS